MKSTFAVIVPWFGGNKLREENFEFTKAFYSRYDVFIGSGSSTGQARNNGALDAYAAGHRRFIFVDSDILVPDAQVQMAVKMSCEYGVQVTAYDRITRTTPEQREEILAGGALIPNPGLPESGAVAMTSSSFAQVNGYPHLSVLEDALMFNACRSLLGLPSRVPGHAFHLWHEPSNHVGDYGHQKLLARSESCIPSPEEMKSFIGREPYHASFGHWV